MSTQGYGGLVDAVRFEDWAARKLYRYQQAMGDSVVEIRDPTHLSRSERAALLRRIGKLNLVVYHSRSRVFTKKELKALGIQLGLNRLDKNLMADAESISSVRVAQAGIQTRYIPYTNRPLGWHTDGCYYEADRTIRSFILHCINPAPDGGINTFLDHEIVYLLIKQHEAKFAASLFRSDAFSVPANISAGGELRSAYSGAVFSFDPNSGHLHMRYTNRSHNVRWNSDPEVRQAVAYLRATIDNAAAFSISHKLEAGQGVICNNVLHKRSAFNNGPEAERQRLVYRARYYDRVVDA